MFSACMHRFPLQLIYKEQDYWAFVILRPLARGQESHYAFLKTSACLLHFIFVWCFCMFFSGIKMIKTDKDLEFPKVCHYSLTTVMAFDTWCFLPIEDLLSSHRCLWGLWPLQTVHQPQPQTSADRVDLFLCCLHRISSLKAALFTWAEPRQNLT